MRVVLVGSGGRESALAWRLVRSPSVGELVVTAAQPGWPGGVRVVAADGVDAIAAVARGVGADLVVVGPEAPLSEGLADRLGDIPCFGPSAAAARLEASKAFAKQVMAEAGVPTAGALTADLSDRAQAAAARDRAAAGEVVVKADGLAAGKGVVVCRTGEEAVRALDAMRAYGSSVVLEDRLEGPEVSLFALCDGRRAVALPSAQDHKTLLDGGAGPNTGGMGAIAPCPLLDDAAADRWVARIHQPVLDVMARRGTPFRGLLYAGLMMTAAGPKVLEFNVRFGDPECQPLMALWEDDPLPWLLGAAKGELPPGKPRFRPGAACCVVLASAGYPAGKQVGVPIPEGPPRTDGVVFHAATRRVDGALQTAGGRVLGVTGWGEDVAAACAAAYAAVPAWRFPGCQLRSDIGAAWR